MKRAWTGERILRELPSPSDEELDELQRKCEKILVGHHPATQGMILTVLVAKWVLGHQVPEMREKILQAHLDSVRDFIKFRQSQT